MSLLDHVEIQSGTWNIATGLIYMVTTPMMKAEYVQDLMGKFDKTIFNSMGSRNRPHTRVTPHNFHFTK